MTERFELLQQLGRGGMGTVWKARDVETGEVVALKLLHSMYVDDPEYVERFEREVEIARRIDSPHVVKVLGFGRRDGVPYVAMEFVDGPSLRERLKASGPVGWDEAKRIATQLTQALAAAHGAGIVHRDIKPSNVLLDPDGQVKLADFGIARANDLTRMTGSVTVLGTPAYMSPDGEASEQSDLYGLGCVLYELLAGSPPFEGESQQQVLLKHIREAPNLERLPSSARKVVGWLLEKEPRRRPASADALLAVLTGSSVHGSGPVKVPSRRPRARWVGVGMLGVAGLGLFGGVVLAMAALRDAGGNEGADDALRATATATRPAPTSTSATSPTATTTPGDSTITSETATPPAGASAIPRPTDAATVAAIASPTPTSTPTATPTRFPTPPAPPSPPPSPTPSPTTSVPGAAPELLDFTTEVTPLGCSDVQDPNSPVHSNCQYDVVLRIRFRDVNGDVVGHDIGSPADQRVGNAYVLRFSLCTKTFFRGGPGFTVHPEGSLSLVLTDAAGFVSTPMDIPRCGNAPWVTL